LSKRKLPTREYVLRELQKLVSGKTNDCVRLLLEETPDLSQLDLRLIEEVKRPKGGGMEVKLLSRIKALELMAELCAKDAGTESALRLGLLSEEETP